MKASFFICAICLTLVVLSERTLAQDQDFRFNPPSAPPLDVDFGDDDDDEMGDFSRPPGAPAMPPPPMGEGRSDARNNGALPGQPTPAPGVVNPNDAPPPGFNGTFGGAAAMGFNGGGYGTPGGNFGGTTTTAGKFRFKIVEGEYWHKGMKRQRGNEMHVTGEDSRADGGGGGGGGGNRRH